MWSTDSCSVYDLHTFRGTLTSTLTFRKELIREVVGDIAKALSDPDRLRTACLPLMCTQVCSPVDKNASIHAARSAGTRMQKERRAWCMSHV